MGHPRGKGALMLFDGHANVRYRFGDRKFRAEGRCAPAVGPDEATIAKRMREQEAADMAPDRPGVREHRDPSGRWPAAAALCGPPRVKGAEA